MSTYTDICEDCGKLEELILAPACADYHTSNHMCCQKYICKNGIPKDSNIDDDTLIGCKSCDPLYQLENGICISKFLIPLSFII